jgi:hypothetical protein
MSGTATPTDDLQTTLGSQPTYERIFDNVQLVVPSVTLSLIKVALWNAIEEFALRSLYFRDLVGWTMPIGVTSVDFNPHSANFSVCWVLGQEGLIHWRVHPPGTIKDLREPLTLRSGIALLALKPLSFDVTLWPELMTNWFETILDGTLFRLYGMPNKPWMNTQLAQYHGTRFRQGVNRARDVAARAYSNQQPAWMYPYAAKGRRKQ